MDLLGGNRKKKRIIIFSIAVFVLLLILLGLLFWFKFNSNNVVSKPSTKTPTPVVKHLSPPVNSTNSTSSTPSKTPITYKESDFSGSLSKFVDHSTFGVLTVISGKVKKTFAIYTDSPVFDASSDRVVSPAKVSSSKGIKVVSVTKIDGLTPNTDSSIQYPLASALILNSKGNMYYSQVSSVEQSGASLYLLDILTKTAYKVLPNTTVENAITDSVYDSTNIAEGTRVFIQVGKPKGVAPTASENLPDSNMSPNYVAKLGAQSDLSKQQRRDNNYTPASSSSLKGYKSVVASKIFVYPYN